mmetsp:Transcript_121829/g.389573  ORF Transcript_121829/g.389573 Transcript_121829/m.389573 type:complete len:117 (+) Transcript_121829:184-534(+)
MLHRSSSSEVRHDEMSRTWLRMLDSGMEHPALEHLSKSEVRLSCMRVTERLPSRKLCASSHVNCPVVRVRLSSGTCEVYEENDNCVATEEKTTADMLKLERGEGMSWEIIEQRVQA